MLFLQIQFFLAMLVQHNPDQVGTLLPKMLANAGDLFIASTACTSDILGTNMLYYMLCLLTEIFNSIILKNLSGKGLLKSTFNVIHFLTDC